MHYDGLAFAPVASGTTVDLKAVFTARPGDVWIGGDGPTLLHWDGTSMTPVTLLGANPGSSVLDLHGIAAGDVWLSGGSFVLPRWSKATSPTSTARRGHRFRVLTFDAFGVAVTQPLARVWELAPDDVWVSAEPLRPARRRARRLHALRRHRLDPAVARSAGLPQPAPPFVFPNRDRPGFVFGPHHRWLADFVGIWQRNTN